MNGRSKIRYGMAGGGEGAFIGAVRRMPAALDGEFARVCGALGSDPGRAYASFGALFAGEAALPDDRRMAKWTALAGRAGVSSGNRR